MKIAGSVEGKAMTRHLFSAVATVLFLVVPASADELPPLHTGVDGTFAPHAFPNLSSGGYQGFNIDLANEFARRLKRNITIDAAQYPDCSQRCRLVLTTSLQLRRP